MENLLSKEEMEAIINGDHGNPFAVLGIHKDKGSKEVFIRTYQPHAQSVELIDENGNLIIVDAHPPVETPLWLRWTLGVISALAIVVTTALTIFMPASAVLTGAIMGGAFETLFECIEGNLDWRKIVIAVGLGAICGSVGSVLFDSISGGLTEAVFTAIDGGSFEDSVNAMVFGAVAGTAIGGALKYLSRGMSHSNPFEVAKSPNAEMNLQNNKLVQVKDVQIVDGVSKDIMIERVQLPSSNLKAQRVQNVSDALEDTNMLVHESKYFHGFNTERINFKKMGSLASDEYVVNSEMLSNFEPKFVLTQPSFTDATNVLKRSYGEGSSIFNQYKDSKFVKMYVDGYYNGKEVSIHFFQSLDGSLQMDVKMKVGWSTDRFIVTKQDSFGHWASASDFNQGSVLTYDEICVLDGASLSRINSSLNVYDFLPMKYELRITYNSIGVATSAL